MLTIWGRLNSHNVKKVAWLAAEIGMPHVRHDVGGQFGMDDAYRALNPNALIPTIEDDGVVLWESNAILRYLAARYAPDLWPQDPVERAQSDKWMDWQFTFSSAQHRAFHGLIRTAPADRDQAAIEQSAAKANQLIPILETTLGRQSWLSGDRFGIGDVPMGVYIHSWFALAIDRPDMPNVAAWYERLKARPHYAEIVMIPLT
ncbi:glutathione S-transferase family protein [Sphingomonas sp. ERG5]|uniref:glutathione S-transferase family protein n=1 Tax=Sphingomonas sp. ERG5 TaxID=1381597 RepID=UPI00054BB3B8|nr:glutathione S-transferase family protein [Sphingomonas sp. ERG5]